jgi:hypothetical protein
MMIKATVVRASEFDRAINAGLNPSGFSRIMIAEGDSWMDVSGPVNPSLPDFLQFPDSVLIIKTAQFGSTLGHIGECLTTGWLNGFINDRGMNLKYAAILFSAGGNDYIDAALQADVGAGLLVDYQNTNTTPANIDQCFRLGAIAQMTDYLNQNFAQIRDLIRTSRHASNTPIFLNMYDVPTVRDAPALPFLQSWLYQSFVRHNIPPIMHQALADKIFKTLQSTITGWAAGGALIKIVPTVGALTPAVANTKASSNDWLNEIHPNGSGWKKLAKIWQDNL